MGVKWGKNVSGIFMAMAGEFLLASHPQTSLSDRRRRRETCRERRQDVKNKTWIQKKGKTWRQCKQRGEIKAQVHNWSGAHISLRISQSLNTHMRLWMHRFAATWQAFYENIRIPDMPTVFHPRNHIQAMLNPRTVRNSSRQSSNSLSNLTSKKNQTRLPFFWCDRS